MNFNTLCTWTFTFFSSYLHIVEKPQTKGKEVNDYKAV